MRPITTIVASLAIIGQTLALSRDPRVVLFPKTHQKSTAQHVFDISDHSDEFTLFTAEGHGSSVPILTDSKDDIAIHLAVVTVADDIEKITGRRPEVYNDTLPHRAGHAVIVGSVNSRLVGNVRGAEYAEELKGTWERFDIRTLSKPIKGVKEGLVITGSDRRGTIFGLYTLTEQLGVSPFYYWSDVPHPKHDVIAVNRSVILSHAEPTVKYRGLFINDEEPAFWGWIQGQLDLDPWEPAFQTWFYKPWFEMMLRLKSNYFWPAMHCSMFSVDGLNTTDKQPKQPLPGPNQILANDMGIVMGTSHHEPMGRDKPEWDAWGKGAWDYINNSEFLDKFWHYGAERAKGLETLYTLGMRGDGDEPLTGASNELVEKIVATQQGILKDVYGDEFDNVPQLWAMYKEVAQYYAHGLNVPEDVTILFSDDNYGNIMSVLSPDKPHPAGAGVYYHVDYVGFPRDYKWINTINLAKMWEQMVMADAFDTNKIWILNIGTLKPLELPTEFFLSLAWNIDEWGLNSWGDFLELWAEREFGLKDKRKVEVRDIMLDYSIMSSRNKAELVNSTAWSINNYEEAERVLAEWDDLVDRSAKVYRSLSTEYQAPFFELVYMLCLMQANLNRLYVSVARSNLYAFQGRTAANYHAKQAIIAFEQDANLTHTFHSMLDGKWDHMLDQTHINYHQTLEPIRDSLPPVSFVQYSQPARIGVPVRAHITGQTSYLRITVENSLGHWPGGMEFSCPAEILCEDITTLWPLDPYGAKTRWIDVGSGGPRDVEWVAKTSHSWLKLSHDHGKIKRDGTADQRIYVSVDWNKVPEEFNPAKHVPRVDITASDRTNMTIEVPIYRPAPPPSDFKGHVQGDEYVVIQAGHHSANTSTNDHAWQEIEGYGHTLSALEVLPFSTKNYTLGAGPAVSYDIWTHSSGNATLTFRLGPQLNLFLGKELAFGLQVDDQQARELHPVPTKPAPGWSHGRHDKPRQAGAVPEDWWDVVSDEIRSFVVNDVDLGEAGQHTIKIWGMTTGVLLQQIWVDFGGIEGRGVSYLGPPESYRM